MVSYPSFSFRSPSFLFLKSSFFGSLFFCLFCHPITFSLAVRNTLNNGHCVSRDLFSTCSTTTPYLLSKSFISPTVQSRDNVRCPALSARSGLFTTNALRRSLRMERQREPTRLTRPNNVSSMVEKNRQNARSCSFFCFRLCGAFHLGKDHSSNESGERCVIIASNQR